MAEVDIDAARAAREEKIGVAAVTLGGRRYALKPSVSFAAGAAWRENDQRAFLEAALADPSEADDFLATPGLGWADLNHVWEAWNANAGEPAAS